MNNTRSTGLLLAALAGLLSACAGSKNVAIEVIEDEAISASALSTRPPRGKSLIVQGDTRLKAGEHYLPALGEQGEKGVVVLDGLRGVTLDLDGVVLRGLPEGSACDAAFGFGIVLRNCEDVRVHGGEVLGYRVAVLVESSRDVVIEDLVVRSGFAGELSGTLAAADPLDRLDLTNQGDSWLHDYGAGVFLLDSSRVTVRDCKVRGSQNGLVAVRSGECSIEDNDFSYLSGWGIALDESEGNSLLGNRCDFVARTPQAAQGEGELGAAGFLLTRGSSDNELIGNSAVRSTVGVLALGSEDRELRSNRFIHNDLSHTAFSAMNIEHASENWILENDALGEAACGLRMADCTRLVISGNQVEHVFGAGLTLRGSDGCFVAGNTVRDCDQGLVVQEGGSHRVTDNRYEDNLQDLVLEGARELQFGMNDYQSQSPDVHLSSLYGLGEADDTPREAWLNMADAEGHLPSGRARDVGFEAGLGEAPLELAAAHGWAESHNDRDARGSGADAGELFLGEFTPWDPASGEAPPGDHPGVGLLGDVSWDATWFAWDDSTDPRGDLERWHSLRYEPLMRARVGAWTNPWGGAERIRSEVGAEHFGLMATGEVYLTRPGRYVLGTLSDDGLRVSIDGKPVYEDWTWHPARREATTVELGVGRHELTLEYFQIDGAAELVLELDRASE